MRLFALAILRPLVIVLIIIVARRRRKPQSDFSIFKVDDELFARVSDEFDEATLIELTAAIAWENASSKFNRALRIESQGLWQP